MSDLTQYLLAQAARRPAAALQFATAELWRRGRMRWVNSIERRLPALSSFSSATAFGPFLLPARRAAPRLCERLRGAEARILCAADAVCRHEFTLLGSIYSAGPHIDWHLDWTTGYRWPDGAADQINVLNAAPGSDVKRPWELARFHHALPLGQAFLLTGEEKYAGEFAAQFLSWLAANPYPRGIHWAMPMEIGIRVVNLCYAAAFFATATQLPVGFWKSFADALFLHGRFLALHREWNPVARGNHYLGSLLGLLHAGALFRESEEGQRWYAEAKEAIQTEMDWQVGQDGVAHEGSSGYHGFVTEMMTTAAVLCARTEHPEEFAAEPQEAIEKSWGRHFCARLEQMFLFPATLCDGRSTPPVLGDADDARLLPLCSAGDAHPLTHVLSLGHALFGSAVGAGQHRCEQATWFVGDATPRRATARAPRHFAQSGFYFFASDRLHASIRCGPLGVNGWANHAHCDQLHVEFAVDGAPVLVDPGTYVYSADAAARNQFRSSRSHNSPMVAGHQQNRFWPGLLFRIMDDTQSQVTRWEEGSHETHFSGLHAGYTRLPQRVHVQREVTSNHAQHSLLICDTLTGESTAPVEWNWQFAPGLGVARADSGGTQPPERENFVLHSVWAAGPAEMRIWLSKSATRAQAGPFPGWMAPRYGVRQAALGLRVSCEAAFPLKAIFEFVAQPATADGIR